MAKTKLAKVVPIEEEEVEISPIDTWNSFIEALLLVRERWEEHKAVMLKHRDISHLPLEGQRQLRYTSIHKASDFDRMLLQFVNRWRTSGGLDNMIVTVPKEKE